MHLAQRLLFTRANTERMTGVEKFSFKKPLAVMLMIGSAAGALSMGLSTPVTQAATSTVTVGGLANVSSLDPTQWAGQILVDQGTILEGLYGYNQKNQIVPKIATGYKLSNGGKTWTITLRHNAKWSNGQPVTANDFYYSWMRQLAPSDSNAQLWASVLNFVNNAYAYHAGTVPASKVGIKVLNKYTIQITTTTPHYILGELAVAASMPLNKQAVSAHPTNWFLPQYFVGDGPYVVKSFTTNGPIVLTRNPKYVGHAGETNVGNVQTINIIPSPTVPLEDFLANKLDVAQIFNVADMKYILSHPALKAQLHSQPQYSISYLQYDNSLKPSPLQNVKVRQAIEMAISRDPIVNQVLSGMGGVTDKFGTPGWPTNKYEKGVPTNVAKAKQLLKEAGYPNGKGIPTLYLYCEVQSVQPNGVPTAEAIQEELSQNLGINTKIEPLAQTQYGLLTYGGPTSGIQPGFNVAVSASNWSDPQSIDMGGSQGVFWPGTYGYSQAFVSHVYPWYNTPYAPSYVKKYGNPANPKLGLSQKDWTAMDAVAKKDIAYLNSWYAKQPQPYRSEVKPLVPLTTQWNQLVGAWKTAKTPAAKHQAWMEAWEFLFPYSAGQSQGGINLNSLEVQVYWDHHMSPQVHNWIVWQKEFQSSTNDTYSAKIAGKLMTQLMQQGYTIPLFYNKTMFLERAGITGTQANPWAWGSFYQFQYLSKK